MSETLLGWEQEIVYQEGDAYYWALERAIEQAQESIKLEVYIFAEDLLAKHFVDLLARAAQRGVNVKILVDGIGSSGWESKFGEQIKKSGAKYKVYHKLSWSALFAGSRFSRLKHSIVRLLQRINQRNHTKLIIVDHKVGFCGSRNIAAVHSERLSGQAAWRDISVCVSGECCKDLELAFDSAWDDREDALRKTRREMYEYCHLISEHVRLNLTWLVRKKNFLDLCRKITSAKERVWVTNSYFLPDRRFLRALRLACLGGADVRVLLPGVSDVPFFPWVADIYQATLLKSKIRVYEYQRSILHAKAIIIDQQAIIGSSNLNRRSLLHDMEVDVVLSKPETINQLNHGFLEDLKNSKEITIVKGFSSSWYQRFLGRIVLLFKYFL